jgi:RNA polymerase sigma-70 factor, ECF subfamily
MHLELSRPGRSSWEPSPAQNTPPGFEELAVPLFDSLYYFAHWLAQNRHYAEDLVQESYLKALRNYEQFEPGTNFRAWIFRILKNTFLGSRSTLERRMTLEMDPGDDWAAGTSSPEAQVITRFEVERVLDAIAQLPSTYRDVLLLCDLEGASYREIADTLSIKQGTVMSRLSRARRMLRKSLRDAGPLESREAGSREEVAC